MEQSHVIRCAAVAESTADSGPLLTDTRGLSHAPAVCWRLRAFRTFSEPRCDCRTRIHPTWFSRAVLGTKTVTLARSTRTADGRNSVADR